MENLENEVVEQATENVEQTTEQTPKTYTQAEVDAKVKEKLDEVLPGKIARQEAKIRKEYEKKYGGLEAVLRSGTGKESVEEMTDTFRKFYESKGIRMPRTPAPSAQSVEALAKEEAEDIIRAGYGEVVAEVDRLAKLGAANMTPREKAVFTALAKHRQSREQAAELTRLGVTKDVYESREFQEFAGKFHSGTPIREICDLYAKTQPRKEVQTMGSVKSTGSGDGGVKDFYTPDEARRFTKRDYDNNPALWKAVQESMGKWK